MSNARPPWSALTDAALTSLERAAVSGLGRLPRPVQRQLSGSIRQRQHGHRIDPEVGAAMRFMAAMPGPSSEQLPLPEARAHLDHEAELYGRRLPVREVRDLVIPTPAGPVPARRYRDSDDAAARLLLYFHGGGWVLGGLESTESVCRFLAVHAGVTVVSVDYRLAPEHPFPAATDDAVEAFRWARGLAGEWGHDPDLVGVAGDSAGGNLATVTCLRLRDAGEPGPAFQALFAPVTDLSTKTASYATFARGFFLTEAQMDWYKGHYLADPAQAHDPYVSPLLAADLSGLPRAYVAVAGFDVLHDEGVAYARRLARAGVPTALRDHVGLVHGFVNATGVGHTGREALLEAVGALRVGLSVGA